LYDEQLNKSGGNLSNIKLIKVMMIFVAIIASTVVVSACGKKSDTASGSESKEQAQVSQEIVEKPVIPDRKRETKVSSTMQNLSI